MYSQNLSQNNQPNLKTLLIIHVALLIGQVMFAIVCVGITPNKGFSFNSSDIYFNNRWLCNQHIFVPHTAYHHIG